MSDYNAHVVQEIKRTIRRDTSFDKITQYFTAMAEIHKKEFVSALATIINTGLGAEGGEFGRCITICKWVIGHHGTLAGQDITSLRELAHTAF